LGEIGGKMRDWGVVGIRNPMNLTNVWCLNKGHAKLSSFPLLPEHKVTVLEGKNSIGQTNYISRMKSITLISPTSAKHFLV